MGEIKINGIRTLRSADNFDPNLKKYFITNKMRHFFINNPYLMVRAFYGFKLPPYQINRLEDAWRKRLYMDSSGYGTGKTFFISLISSMRGILFPDRICGIISHTYGGVKLVFNYFEEWFEEIPAFRAQFDPMAKSPVSKAADLMLLKYANGNTIRGCPPSILGNALRLRSERWNDGFFDEWAHFSNQEVIDTVMNSRCTRRNHNTNHAILCNHISYFSTPGYKTDASYQRAKMFITEALINKNPKFGYQRYSYEDLKGGYEYLTDLDIIEMAKRTLPQSLYDRDYLGKWVAASRGYYPQALIVTIFEPKLKPLLKGREGYIYIKGVDVARSIKGKGDDFSVSVIEVNPDVTQQHRYCYSITLNNIEVDEMSAIIHEIDEIFPGPMIILDPGGGGQFLTGPLAKPDQNLQGRPRKVIPIYPVDSPMSDGKNTLYFFSRGTFEIKDTFGSMAGDDVLVNTAHSILKGMLEHKQIIAPFMEGISDNFAKKMTFKLGEHNEYEAQYFNIALALNQLMNVELEVDRQTNAPKRTSRGQFIFTSKKKKDAAYGLMYAVFGLKLWIEMQANGQKDSDALGHVEDGELFTSDDDGYEFEETYKGGSEDDESDIYTFAEC